LHLPSTFLPAMAMGQILMGLKTWGAKLITDLFNSPPTKPSEASSSGSPKHLLTPKPHAQQQEHASKRCILSKYNLVTTKIHEMLKKPISSLWALSGVHFLGLRLFEPYTSSWCAAEFEPNTTLVLDLQPNWNPTRPLRKKKVLTSNIHLTNQMR
jgi:hypothetical protein